MPSVSPTSRPANRNDVQRTFAWGFTIPILKKFVVLFLAEISDIQPLLFGGSESGVVIARGLAIGYSIKLNKVVL